MWGESLRCFAISSTNEPMVNPLGLNPIPSSLLSAPLLDLLITISIKLALQPTPGYCTTF